MRTRSAALVLVLATLLPLETPSARGAAPRGRPPVPRELEDAKARVVKTAGELTAALGRLSALSAEYSGARDLDEMARRREPLRAEASAALTRFRDDLRAFRGSRKEYRSRQEAESISAALDGGRKSELRGGLQEMIALDDVLQDMDPLAFYGAMVLDQDLAAFAAERARRGTLLRSWVVGGAACLLLGAFLVLFSRADRRRREPVPALMDAPAEPGLPARPAVPLLPEGSVLGGGFRVVRPLGPGSLGPVYDAVESSTGRRVVIKRLRNEFHLRERDLDRLLALARRVAALQHPNLAEVLSVFIESGRVHLAIERIDGAPLSESLRESRGLPLGVVKHVLWQVSDVLGYAHERGVLHGDLRPSNVFLLEDNVVKVLDFGVGLEARKLAAKLSWAGPAGGLAYIAPEEELGCALPESDVYSLGVLLYELLTGRLPFEGPDLLAKKRAMRYAAPGRLARLPAEVDAALERALQAEPSRRFRTPGELFEAVDAAPEVS